MYTMEDTDVLELEEEIFQQEILIEEAQERLNKLLKKLKGKQK